jgi:predicted metal-dependent HD superfamily phosphohydrolase
MYDLDRLARKWQQYRTDRLIDLSSEKISKHQNIDARVEMIGERVFGLLVSAYTKPDRHYHNLNHIDRLLTTIDRFSDLHNPISVDLAVWFHDFVYDPQSSDNEAQSAKSAQDLLTNLGESIATIERVQQLIMATQGHQINPTLPQLPKSIHH